MLRILFACTGDSGRSQMAAAFANQFKTRNINITCAGDRQQTVLSIVHEVMNDIGLEVPNRVEHSLTEIRSKLFDVVITLCDHAREICPTFPGAPARIHWSLVDPAKKHELDSEKSRALFREIRDEIQTRVAGMFEHGFLAAIYDTRSTLKSLLNNLTDGVLAHDQARRIFFFNQAAQDITGYREADVIGRDCHDIFSGRFCGGDCSFCVQGVQKQTRLRFPQSYVKPDGLPRDLEMSVITISHREEDEGALVIFRDVSEIINLRRQLNMSRETHGIVGRHISMRKVFDAIRELADVNVPILIQGESGTGKEMVANALHNSSSRSEYPFVPVNCGALPEGTLESELFGHVRGAFTGAFRDKKGRFELADKGTIFLDEIGEISLATQVKLLRVLQEKSFEPVGGEVSRNVDVRIICAANRNLRELTQQNLFREDLYYRLAVVPIFLPPLRERRSDIPLLLDHFLQKYSAKSSNNEFEVTPEAMALLIKYNWHGNVRELSNSVQFAIIKSHGGIIDLKHLPPEIAEELTPSRVKLGRPQVLSEEDVIVALKRTGGNKAKAAKILGISRTTLYRFLRNNKVFNNTDV